MKNNLVHSLTESRTESVNFIHDVNVLRQTLKTVYSSSADLQALNSEIDKLPKNCRVQVLPVCWRHLLDFPRKGVRQNRREHDLGDAYGDDEDYPSLEDITIEGVPFVRSLITDLGLSTFTAKIDVYANEIQLLIFFSIKVLTESTSATLSSRSPTVFSISSKNETLSSRARLVSLDTRLVLLSCSIFCVDRKNHRSRKAGVQVQGGIVSIGRPLRVEASTKVWSSSSMLKISIAWVPQSDCSKC